MKTHSKYLIVAIAILTLIASVSLAQAPAEKNVTVFGAKINYVEAGDPAKPKVILLHGLGGSIANWAMSTPAIRATTRNTSA